MKNNKLYSSELAISVTRVQNDSLLSESQNLPNN